MASFAMEITVVRNAGEILSLSAFRKSTSPGPWLTWTTDHQPAGPPD